MTEKRIEVSEQVRLGDWLKAARQKNRLTLKEVAEHPEVGVSSTFLSRVERNDALPSDDLLLKLCRRLSLDESTALMHLFREKTSPGARRFVPSLLHLGPKVEPRPEAGLPVEGPLQQVRALFGDLHADNARLRQTNAALRDEVRDLTSAVAESKRAFLPDVNRFLVSLFNYESDVVRRDVVVSRNGDCTIHVTLEGIRPVKGAKPIRNLTHSVYLPHAADGKLTIANSDEELKASFRIWEKPPGLAMTADYRDEGGGRGTFQVNFTDGYQWSADPTKLSYSFAYRLDKAFAMTLEDAAARYKNSVQNEPLEWSACFINKPVHRLEMSVTFPEGYAPRYVDRWVWWTETSFLENDNNLAEKLLAEPADGIEIEEGERTRVHLRAQNPLLGFSYAIVWRPPSKRQVFTEQQLSG
jgi:transcriptional regulator with XRE-family HTH domain